MAGGKSVSVLVSWERKPKNIQCLSTIALTLIEIVLLRKAYCSLCTDTASNSTDIVSYSTNMVSYGSSDKKGLPTLCSVLPPACLQHW